MRVKKRPLNQSGLESSPSSFIITAIRDEKFFQEPAVFLVYNRPDASRLPQSTNGSPSPGLLGSQKKGKPAGYGMPGGGVNPEHLENADQAAKREGGNESALKIIRVDEIDMIDPMSHKRLEHDKALISHKKTGEFIRFVMYARGKQKKIEIAPWENAKFNPMNYYLAKVDWMNSGPREFFLNLKADLMADGILEEEIARFGLSVNDLTREELLALGVDEEEVGKIGDPEETREIGGFALLPISLIRSMVSSNWYFLDINEDKEVYERNGKIGPTSYVYRSHCERIVQAYDILGIV